MQGESPRVQNEASGSAGWTALFRRSLTFLAPDKLAVAGALIVTLAGAAVGALEPLVLGRIIDALTGGVSLNEFLLPLGILLGLVVGRELFQALSNWLSWKVRLRVHHRILSALVDRLNNLPLSYHREQSVGGTMTRLDRAIQGYLDALNQFAFKTLPTLAYLGLGIFLMAQLDPRLTLVVVAFVPLPALIGHIAAKEQTRRERTLLDHWTRLYARWNEVLHGIATVKSFSKEDDEKDRFLGGVAEANDVVDRGVAYDSTMGGISNLMAALARIVAIAVGGYFIIQGSVTVGVLVAFLGYIGGLFGPVQGLTGAYQTARKAQVSLEEIYSVLDAEDKLRDRPGASPVDRVEGRVDFDHVTLLDQRGHPILDDVTVHVEPGETIAIVGPSGSGKTTLMSVLQRLYDPHEGQVRVDGTDLRDLQQRSYRERIGVVPQEPVLFNDTVRGAIAYARPEASLDEVRQAARAAHALPFIERLPGGFEATVGERGAKLSAGQRQRIAIARAMLKDPDMVILDEPTSALDAESEAHVQEALDELVEGRTTFVIAHRLSTVVGADRIVVLREGRVEDVGTHDELIQRGGYYALLVRHQVSGLLPDRLLTDEGSKLLPGPTPS